MPFFMIVAFLTLFAEEIPIQKLSHFCYYVIMAIMTVENDRHITFRALVHNSIEMLSGQHMDLVVQYICLECLNYL